MEIKEQIQRILDNRRLKGAALYQKKEALLNIKAKLKECDGLYAQAKSIGDEKLQQQYMKIFSQIQTRAIQRDIDDLVRRLDAGIRRFERDYISIATVGKARQGKSRFLQSVGNLNNEVIPAYSGVDCTGATSIIHNTPDMKPGEVKVALSFRSRDELTGIVTEYIRGIDENFLEDELRFEDIPYIDLPRLEMRIEKDDPNKKAALMHLTNIVDHFSTELEELAGHGQITLTDPEEIKRYVAQNNGKDKLDPERENYYSYLAVSRAEIYCRFYEDCGKLVLVDTVGLGDTQYGIEDAMLETVDKECDAAFVLIRPQGGVNQGDLELYNLLKGRFRSREMSQWLFYIVNHIKGENGNSNVVNDVADAIRENNFGICDCCVVDCADEKEVRNKFLLPALQKLVGNMDAIDNAYLKEINELGRAVMEKYRNYISEMPEAKAISVQGQAGVKAFLKGKECYHRMTADLSNQVTHWSREKDKPNSALWNRVQGILNNFDNVAPSEEMLQKAIDENGSLLPMDLWHAALHYTRNDITDQFISIDGIMEKETRSFKNSLVRHLYFSLKHISDEEESGVAEEAEKETQSWNQDDWDEADACDMIEWLKNVMEHVINDKPQYAQIYKAFQFLYQFEFNTRAQMIQEIRRQLYIINPICDEYAMPNYNFHKTSAGKEVYFYLTSRLSVIEENLRYVLVDMYRMPNQAFYAAAEEFYDRLTFASNLKDGQFVSMDTVWGQFFLEYSNKLWADNSARYEQVNSVVKQYNDILAGLDSLTGTVRF